MAHCLFSSIADGAGITFGKRLLTYMTAGQTIYGVPYHQPYFIRLYLYIVTLPVYLARCCNTIELTAAADILLQPSTATNSHHNRFKTIGFSNKTFTMLAIIFSLSSLARLEQCSIDDFPENSHIWHRKRETLLD